MAISKKGLRKIVVDDQEFYWKFNDKIYVVSETNKNQLLIVDFGWFDIWLYVNDKENRPPDYEPRIVTPSFVAESILFALKKGWQNDKMELKFRDEKYEISSKN